MSYKAIKYIPLTVYGQIIEGVTVPIGSSVEWDFTCQDPSARTPIPLTTGFNVSMGLCALDERGLPMQPPLFTHQATITDINNGLCNVTWTPGDTAPTVNNVIVPLAPGLYGVDLWLTDDAGNRLALLAFVVVRLLPFAVGPGQQVTPSPPTQPLGVGPPGLSWSLTFHSATHNLNFLEMAVDDPTAGSFNANLPAISSLPANSQGIAVAIINDAAPSSANTVGAVPNGTDRIRIGGTTQSLYLVNQGEVLRLQPVVKVGGNLWYAW